MTTNAQSTHHTIVCLKPPRKVSSLGAYAQQIVTAMTGNGAFPTPAPPLSSVASALTAFQAAEAIALTRAKGAAEARNVKRVALLQLLEQLKAYVQTVVDAAVDDGAAIALGAGMAVRKTPVRPPRVFAAKPGAVTGTVKLVAAAAARRAAYTWQYSTDGGKTWISLPPTLHAKTTASGLTAGTRVEFRYQALTEAGESNWSQGVQLLVP